MTIENIVLHACKYTDGLHRKCDNNCLFCSENTDQDKTNKTLPSIEMMELALSDIKENINNIYIAGGEPTMRKDLQEIVKLCVKYAPHVYLSTHGNYINSNEIAIELKNCGLTNVAFSLHGHDKETHDKTTRVDGSFENSKKAIKNFLANDLVTHVNCVVTSINIDQLDKVVGLAAKEFPRIKHLTFSHYRHHGEACENLFLNFNVWDRKETIKEAIDLAEKTGLRINFRDFPLCLEPRLKMLNSKVENFYVVLWGKTGEHGLYAEDASKILLPMCDNCTEEECSGYIAANIEQSDKYSAWAEKV